MRNKCDNCDGTGYLPEYSHICGGKCFTCNGTGFEVFKKKKKETTDNHRDYHHVTAFQDALQIEHIFAWIDQDYTNRVDNDGGKRY